jgi:hypothetical protein
MLILMIIRQFGAPLAIELTYMMLLPGVMKQLI